MPGILPNARPPERPDREAPRFQAVLLAILLAGFMTLPGPARGQSARAFEKAGDKATAASDSHAALLHYGEALAREPEDIRLWYKYADAARGSHAWAVAATYFQKVTEHERAADHPLAGFLLGQALKSQERYAEALQAFRRYQAQETGPEDYRAWCAEEIRSCEWVLGGEAAADGEQYRADPPGRQVNSPFSEFGAVQRGGDLYYSSLRFEFPGDRQRPPRKLTKVMVAKNRQRGRPMPGGFNATDRHTAHTAFSTDGSRLYFTLCQYEQGNRIRCELYYRERDRRGRWKQDAVRLPDIINKKDFTTTQPSIGFDSLSGQEILFFVSDRNGGAGKLDLWYTPLTEGRFLEPTNLTALNTPENDISPFFDTPAQCLFYSSDRQQPSFGGYDIFRADCRNLTFARPENIGRPFNSGYHDLYFSTDGDSVRLLSSNRPGSLFLDAANQACCFDIYRFVRIPSADPPSPAGPDTTAIPFAAQATAPADPATPTRLSDYLPLALYFDNDEPDRRTSRTTTRKSYETTFDTYYARKQTYLERCRRGLPAEKATLAEADMEDFFETVVRKGRDDLALFTDLLHDRLAGGSEVSISIRGYTSPRAQSEYNDRLAQRRISSLRNHFETWHDGALLPFIRAGTLQLVEVPFGETTAAANVSDDLVDERNSIYSLGAARERRVEIVAVSDRPAQE